MFITQDKTNYIFLAVIFIVTVAFGSLVWWVLISEPDYSSVFQIKTEIDSTVYCEVDKEYKIGECECPKGTLEYARFATINICRDYSMGNMPYIGNWKGYYINEEYGFSVRYPEILIPIEIKKATLPPNYDVEYNAIKFIPIEKAQILGKNDCSYGESGEITTCRAEMEFGIEFIYIDKRLEDAVKFLDPELLNEEYLFGRREIVYRIGAGGRGKDYYFIPAENYKTLVMVRFYDEEFGPNIGVFYGMLDRLKLLGVPDNPYDIFGGSEFGAKVDGYLQIKNWEIIEENELFDVGTKGSTAYFIITKYHSEEFEGGMNRLIYLGYKDGHYIGLGNLENNKIIGIKWADDGTFSDAPEAYIDENTTKALLNSSKENLISVILSFGKHRLNFGCGAYCNHVKQVKLDNQNF